MQMTILQATALFIAGILAGALNSVAGGGSLISFPTLLFAGVPAIPANATNAMAVWPGSIASIPPYRKDLSHERRELIFFSVISMVGGILGAIVLLRTPPRLFEQLIPWLLLFATLIFAFGGQITKLLRGQRATLEISADEADAADAADAADEEKDGADDAPVSPRALAGVGVIQFAIALYGGFFGGGMGIMMLAGFALLGMRRIHAMNALKVVLASIINGVAVIAFAIAGKIYWAQALVMVVGAIIGGYGGAALAHRVPPRYVRWFAIAVGVVASAYLFYKYDL